MYGFSTTVKRFGSLQVTSKGYCYRSNDCSGLCVCRVGGEGTSSIKEGWLPNGSKCIKHGSSLHFAWQRMQHTAEAMKSSDKELHSEQEQSDLNRSRRSGRWGFNVTERKLLEMSVQRIDRPIAANIKMQSSIYLQAAAKLADTAHVLTRPKPLMGFSKPRPTTSITLPPISRSKAISGKVERAAALPPHRKESAKPKGYGNNLPTGNRVKENAMPHVLVTQCGKVIQESNKYKKISAALAAGNKAEFLDPESHSRLMKGSFDGQPAATLIPAPVESPLRQKNNDSSDPGASHDSTVKAVKVKHDASLCGAGRQRGFCSTDSAIETESEGSEDKGHRERLKDDEDDEYYTDQRITEWVLRVNSSFFTMGHDELTNSKPAEELDVATIKIIYTGDWKYTVLV